LLAIQIRRCDQGKKWRFDLRKTATSRHFSGDFARFSPVFFAGLATRAQIGADVTFKR
jgi:hypothetical protein